MLGSDKLTQNIEILQTYLTLLHAQLPPGMTIYPETKGYIERVLRFEIAGEYKYAAVLNKNSVLWYFRKPTLHNGGGELILARFPKAQFNPKGEITLRLLDPKDAKNVIDWVRKTAM